MEGGRTGFPVYLEYNQFTPVRARFPLLGACPGEAKVAQGQACFEESSVGTQQETIRRRSLIWKRGQIS